MTKKKSTLVENVADMRKIKQNKTKQKKKQCSGTTCIISQSPSSPWTEETTRLEGNDRGQRIFFRIILDKATKFLKKNYDKSRIRWEKSRANITDAYLGSFFLSRLQWRTCLALQWSLCSAYSSDETFLTVAWGNIVIHPSWTFNCERRIQEKKKTNTQTNKQTNKNSIIRNQWTL